MKIANTLFAKNQKRPHEELNYHSHFLDRFQRLGQLDEAYAPFCPSVRERDGEHVWIFKKGLKISEITQSMFLNNTLDRMPLQITTRHMLPSLGVDHARNEIIKLGRACENLLADPQPDMLNTFYKSCSWPNLITKLRLFPSPTLLTHVHSLLSSIKMYLEPEHYFFITQTGSKILGSDCVSGHFETSSELLGLPAVDFTLEHSFFGTIFVDTGSSRLKATAFEKMSKMMSQLNSRVHPENACVLVGVACHEPLENPVNMSLKIQLVETFDTTKSIVKDFKGKDQAWKDTFRSTVDSTLTSLMQSVKPHPGYLIADSIVNDAIITYRDTNDLDNRVDFVRRNKATFDMLGYPDFDESLKTLKISTRLKDTIRYTDCKSFPDLQESKPYLKSILDASSLDDPILKILLASMSHKSNECYRVDSELKFYQCDPTEINKDSSEAVYPGDTVAYIRRFSECELLDGPLQAQLILKPSFAESFLAGYALHAFYPYKRVQKQDLREPIVPDLKSISSQIISDEQYLDRKSEVNEMDIYHRKKLLLNMSPSCISDNHVKVVEHLMSTCLGSVLNHQYEIGNIVMTSIKNNPSNTFTLVRNGNLGSFTLIKNSTGGSSFTNCPIKVYWHSSSDHPIRNPGSVVDVGEGFLRSTSWHSVDARILRWYIDQTVAVESRLATIESVSSSDGESAGRISLVTFPNSQDFSQASGLFKNMIDCLESIDAVPQGIMEKSEGLVFNQKMELWYYTHMLSTFYTGMVIREAKMFVVREKLRSHDVGSTAISFPDFRQVVTHPEIITNFQNSFHMLVKFKTNKTAAEARDWLGVIKEKVVYERKVEARGSKIFGWTDEDVRVLRREKLDTAYVTKSIRESWESSGKGKKGSRYSWNLFYILRTLLHEVDMNGDRFAQSDDEFWHKMFNTPVDEYLIATGSMVSNGIDYAISQSRRKSTSLYELIWMYNNNTTKSPLSIKGEVISMVNKHGEQVVTTGHLLYFICTRDVPPCSIRLLDKDQVEGNREISALDVITMLITSIHEKEWAVFSKRHPIDCIMSSDKSRDMRRMLDEVGTPGKDEVLVEDNKDCSRYGPNVDLLCMSVHSQYMFPGIVGDVLSLGEHQMYTKHYKPPESLAKSYTSIKFSKTDLVEREGDFNKALHSIQQWCPSGGLSMEGGMGQGILGVGASCNTSMAVQYCNYLYRLASTNIINTSSMVTSDDGHDTHRIKANQAMSTAKWISHCRIKLMSMANNIINTAKSGLNFNNKSMNSIRMFRRKDGVMIETVPFFKFITSKVSLPESLSYLEDCIKANIVGSDLCKMGVPADIAIVNTVHSLFLCCTLHKKWKLFHDLTYFTVPAILGGPVGPCIVETMVSPLASVAVFGGLVFESNEADLRVLSQSILRPALSSELEKTMMETDFHSQVSLVKKSVDGLRFTRKVSKTDRRAFHELFQKRYDPGGIPNLLFGKQPVTLRDTTSTFIFKLSQGTAKENVPNNKYLMTWGAYRKSYNKKNINVFPGSPLSYLFKETTISTEDFEKIVPQFTVQMMQDSIASAAQSRLALRTIYQDNGQMHDVVENLLVSKLMLCRQIRTELNLAAVRRAYTPEQQLLLLQPYTTSRLRPKRDVQNLEQEVKRSIFLDLSGKEGAKYIRDTFFQPVFSDKNPVMGISAAIQVADNIATNVVDFLTLRERTVKIKASHNFNDDRSFIIQFMKHNISYNKEYEVSKDDIMNIVTYPLKDFLNQMWSADLVDEAVEANNHACVESLFSIPRPPVRYVQTDRDIRSKEDLNGVPTTNEITERFGVVVPDVFNSVNSQLIRISHQLHIDLKLTNEFIRTALEDVAKAQELSGLGQLWVNTSPLRVVWKEGEKYNHEIYGAESLKMEKNDMGRREFMPSRGVYQTFEIGPLICVKLHNNPTPISRMKLMDPSPEMLFSSEVHDLKTHSRSEQVLRDVLFGDFDLDEKLRASLEWISSDYKLSKVPCETYLSFLGRHKKAERSLFLPGDKGVEKFIDLETVDFLVTNTNVRVKTLRPVARVVIDSLQKHKKEIVRPTTSVRLIPLPSGTKYNLSGITDHKESSRKDSVDSEDEPPDLDIDFLDAVITEEERKEMMSFLVKRV